jgi:hypothetical protein
MATETSSAKRSSRLGTEAGRCDDDPEPRSGDLRQHIEHYYRLPKLISDSAAIEALEQIIVEKQRLLLAIERASQEKGGP